MKALMKLKSEPGLQLREVEVPNIQDHEVLIKVKKTAICGTDLHILEWNAWAQKTIHVPLIIGHEFMGEIVKIGKAISHLKVGTRVSGEGHITCGICRNCREGKQHLCPNTLGIGVQRDGAFAEYIALPAINVIPIPDSLSDDIATLLDPLGNAVHTTLCFDLIGEDVLITGAGPIGLMAVAVAKQVGAGRVVITDVNEYRLDLAKNFGATETINTQQLSTNKNAILKRFQENYEFTVGLEMSGYPDELPLILDSLSNGGNIALLGIPERPFAIDWDKVIFKGLTIKGIYGRKMFETWDKMLHLLQTGLNITPVITHHFKAEDFNNAFKMACSGKAGKIILDWE